MEGLNVPAEGPKISVEGPKALLAILLIMALIFSVAGIITIVAAPRTIWELKSVWIYDKVVSVLEWEKSLLPPYSLTLSTEKIYVRNLVVMGNVVELNGLRFNFYVFSLDDYELWRAGKPYRAYVEKRNITTSFFLSTVEFENATKLKFVIENPTGSPLAVKLVAGIVWEEPSYARVIDEIIVGSALMLVGAILVIAATIVKKEYIRDLHEHSF